MSVMRHEETSGIFPTDGRAPVVRRRDTDRDAGSI